MAKKIEYWRVRLFLSLIRQVRGRSLVEALHRLQDGNCAYDRAPTALLLPNIIHVTRVPILKRLKPRFATVDHVLPKSLGGQNIFPNLVMSSQGSNARKGCRAPEGNWVPHFQHTQLQVARSITSVEQHRLSLAEELASSRRLLRQDAVDQLVEIELARLGVNFGFNEERSRMVA